MTYLHLVFFLFLTIGLFALLSADQAKGQYHPVYWEVHDNDRPQPPVIDPGPASESPRTAPEDAIVLFDGTGLDNWTGFRGGSAGWRVENGYMEVVPGSGDIQTAESFGDVQLYVEWAAPEQVEGSGQGRGNSGVFLMQRYEVQVLDSYDNPTYPDGMAASVYGQFPPLVNASRPPGEWQSYNIIFHRPRFDENERLVRPARMTVFHNDILVIDNVELTGPTAHQRRPPYEAHESRLPIRLQDHGDKVRYRKIWLRELE